MIDGRDAVDGYDPDGAVADRASAVDTRPARRARVVTYALVAGLLLAAQLHVEQWPITAFQLFSQVRSDETVTLEMVAVTPDGERRVVRLGAQAGRVGNPGHQLRLLRADTPGRQRATALEWLGLAGLDADAYSHVQLERVRRRLDPDGGPAEELSRTVVTEIPL